MPLYFPEDMMHHIAEKQRQQQEAIDKLMRFVCGEPLIPDPLEDLKAALARANKSQDLAQKIASQHTPFEDVLKLVSPYSPLLEKQIARPWIDQANEALDKAIHEPGRSITLMFVRSGLDSPDIHSEQFLDLIGAYRSQAEDNPTLHTEPIIRLITAYDIVLVLEKRLKEFMQKAIEAELDGDWWGHID